MQFNEIPLHEITLHKITILQKNKIYDFFNRIRLKLQTIFALFKETHSILNKIHSINLFLVYLFCCEFYRQSHLNGIFVNGNG